ncbi:hypothetical protein Nepgr_028288 [Nepenthes gracilis]|uniref:Uncharacterized protein n=1 Tax=Nepenthes gracilis TaxID=150966 RepID=A0AAD3Y3T1_NEPGR|nr:hypothetical protein Nepgr_028288 [Nepenthes gracilis]
MAETTASDHHVDIAPNPAASSHDAVEPSHENEPGRTGRDAREPGCCSRVCLFLLVLITLPIIAVALLICCLCALLAYLTFGKDVLSLKTVAEKLWGRLCFKAGGGNTGQFVLPELEKRYKDLNWSTAATAAFRWRLLLLSLLCLVIVVSVPALKRTKVLGLPLWKWTVLAAVVTVGYHAFSLLIQCTVKKLSRKKEDKYDVVYYADGLRRSVNNVSFWVFILLAWEHYFRSSRHGLRRYGFSEKALDIGTWTVVSLLVGKILLLAKNVVMLSWESHAIYRQFTDNIGNVGPQLYFLGLVSSSKFDIFSPWEEDEDKGVGEGMNKPSAEENNGKQEDVNEKENKVKAAGESGLSSRKDNTIPEEIRKHWEEHKKDDSNSSYTTKDSVKKNLQDLNITTINDEEIDQLFDELRVANNLKNNKDSASTDKDEIPYDTFEEWMTRAFKNCLSLGYMLSDAQGAANNLNNIMRAFVVIVVILCWLLLTGIASTKVLVTIASSFLAATFIFGDTLKATFEGIIFAFVAQQFIIGDLCIIDDIQVILFDIPLWRFFIFSPFSYERRIF